MKKILISLFIFITILSIAGCGEKASEEDENTLTLMAQTSYTGANYIQRIIELYEKSTGNKIKIISFDASEYEEKASKAFEDGDIPDLFTHFNDANLSGYNISENFYYMNDQPWVDELVESVKDYSCDDSGNILGLPFWENSISGCYYNKKILDDLGLRAAYTQAEFDTLCSTLKSIGYTPLYWASSTGCNWMFQFGLDPIFADNPELLERLNSNEITYADIPAVKDMITWLDNAKKQGWFNNDYEVSGWDAIAPAMENGEAVFIFVWDTWFDTDFSDGGKYNRDDFALMPIFMNTVETGTYEGGNMDMLMVNKNSEKLQMALDFLSFCAMPENYNVAFDGVPTINCFKNQTTNIQDKMVTDAEASVKANHRVSTAWPKIIGYKQDDVGAAVLQMFQGKVDVEGCIKLMDDCRIAAAKELGAEGF